VSPPKTFVEIKYFSQGFSSDLRIKAFYFFVFLDILGSLN